MERLETYFLVEAIKAGNLLAFEKVYKIYYSKLYRFAVKFNKASLDPDDFVHQTFLTLWEKKDQLKEDILLDKQIYVICKNIILNQLKRDQKIEYGYQALDRHLPNSNEDEGHDDESFLRKNKLKKLIDQMPEKRKEIFLLHKINNLSYEEISENLGISKKTIANHIYLATNYLKEKI